MIARAVATNGTTSASVGAPRNTRARNWPRKTKRAMPQASASKPSSTPRAMRPRRPSVMRHSLISKYTCRSPDRYRGHSGRARRCGANAGFSTAVELYCMAMVDRIPPLAALRAFAAVARHGSFARAAATLHVSTSAVSHQVRGLEDALGAALLTRARNGAGRTVVTAEGAALQRAVERAFAQLGAACEAVRDRRKRPVLTISASGSVASLWLAPRLAAFATLHPSVQWQMRSIEDEEPDMVREGLDLAILRVRRGAVAEGDLLLFHETVFPVCSPSLRLAGSPDELPRHTLLQEDLADHVASREKDWSTWLEL